jgi:hypothetical protein
MSKVLFTRPDGDTIENPSASEMGKDIISGGQSFWNTGSGEGAIEFNDGQRRAIVGVRFSESHGFSIEFREFEKGSYWGPPFITYPKSELDRVVVTYIGGADLKLPEASFVSPSTAKTILLEFCQSGHRSQAVGWKRVSEIPEEMYG